MTYAVHNQQLYIAYNLKSEVKNINDLIKITCLNDVRTVHTHASNGGTLKKQYITLLGRKRLIRKEGRTKYVMIKGEQVKLSVAKQKDAAEKASK